MRSSVIILSNKRDAHIPFVAQHLATKPIVIDFQEIVNHGQAGVIFDKGQLSTWLQVQHIQPSGVWLRRPLPIRNLHIPVAAEHADYARSALIGFTDMFFSLFPDALWISDYYAILRAENKPIQQQKAAQLGFAVPATLYAADADLARRFIEKHLPVVVKTLATYIPPTKLGEPQAFYTRIIKTIDELALDNLRLAPAIFQELIHPYREFRVTVVGNHVFATQVTSTGPDATVRDWRAGQQLGQTHFRSYRLPQQIQRQCIELTQQLGLQFGAIDLIEDKSGTFWFLEINPNGQWAFIEQATGQSIGKALANILQATHP